MRSKALGALLLAPLLLFACDSSETGNRQSPSGDQNQGSENNNTPSNNNPDPDPEPRETLLRWGAQPEAAIMLVVPNIDDDDRNKVRDFDDDPRAEDGDRGRLEAHPGEEDKALTFEGDASKIRVYVNGAHALGQDKGSTYTLSAASEEAASIEVEVAESGHIGTLSLGDKDLLIQGVAPTMGHHLLPTQKVWVAHLKSGLEGFPDSYNNTSMVEAMKEALGDKLVVLEEEDFEVMGLQDPFQEEGVDVWAQDEFESFGLWTPDAEIQLIMNSPRDRPMDVVVRKLSGPEIARVDLTIKGTPDEAFGAPSQDYGGNIEVTPPVTVNGTHYPLGRIYYGTASFSLGPGLPAQEGPSDTVKNFLHGTSVQDPIVLDSKWLCVGHVDEFVTFLPDPDAPRGFKVFVADVEAGITMLQNMSEDVNLDRYAPGPEEGGYGYANPAALLGDTALIAYNRDIQRDNIDANMDILRRELALQDEEIVRVPALFKELNLDGSCAEALLPGTVNLLMVTNEEGNGGTAIIPDPFLRPSESTQDNDPLVQFWKDNAPDTLKLLFVDDWYVYHLGGGEVHCGTNQTRSPALSKVDTLAPWTQLTEEEE